MTMRITTTPWTLHDLPTPPTTALEGAQSTLDAIDKTLNEYSAEKPIKTLQQVSAAFWKVFDATDSGFKLAARRYYDGSPALQLASKSSGGSPELANLADKFWQQTVAELAAERAERFARLAEAVVNAMKDARAEIATAGLLATGPAALREEVTADTEARVRALRSELGTYKPTTLQATYAGLLLANDEERTELFEAAIEPLLLELARMSVPELAQRLMMSPSANGGIGAERDAVTALMRQIQEQQVARRPAWLSVAADAYDALLGVFRATLGFHASRLDGPSYAQWKASPRDELAVLPNWFAASLPRNAPAR